MSMTPIPGLPGLNIRNIFCIGRNYSKHAQELGNDTPDEPIVFLKPLSSVIFDGGTILLPPQSNDVHHEAELVIALKKGGSQIPEENALNYVAGYGIGIDVTARDLQQTAKKNGLPWSVAKGFDTFAPLSSFIDANQVTDPQDLAITLQVNDEIRQDGNTQNMIFPVSQLVAYLSTIFTLAPGDLIFSGTPAGVSALKTGDHIRAMLGNNLTSLNMTVNSAE